MKREAAVNEVAAVAEPPSPDESNGAQSPPLDGPVADLARELLAASGEGLDWRAEVRGAVRRVVIRSLQRGRRERTARLAVARGEEAERLMFEIREIADRLNELSKS